MKPRLLVPFAFAMAGIVMGDACTAPNEQTLVINAVFAPNVAASAGGPCGASGSEISSGLLDVTLASGFNAGYLLFPSVVNKQQSNASYNGGLETDQIIIDTARIDIALTNATSSCTAANCTSFDEQVYVYIPPGASASVPVTLLPASLVKGMTVNDNATAQVSLQFVGKSNNNTIKSNTMKFSISLCKGCLQNNIGACCAPAMNLGLCNPGQDAPVDCCNDPSGALRCPAEPITGVSCTSDAGSP